MILRFLLAFTLEKLTENQRKYFTFDREFLPTYKEVQHFKPQIEGENVTLFMDDKPLSVLF